MNRTTILQSTISLAVFVACAGLASGASADDENKGTLGTVKVARSGDTVSGARATKASADVSLSAKIALPMLNPNPILPKVILSEGHKQTCLKRIGDKIDAMVLKDVDGRDVKLNDELSEQLTVVIFWSEQSVSGYEQFRRIPVDVLAKFAPYRVKVVAVNIGGTVAETKRLTGSASGKILSLADSDSGMFAQFAKAHLPRTYVLDKEGRIMWFDIEYSEATRRDLDNALTYFLKQAAADKK